MSATGSGVTSEVKVNAKTRKGKKAERKNESTIESKSGNDDTSAFELVADEKTVKIEQENESLTGEDKVRQNGRLNEENPPVNDVSKTADEDDDIDEIDVVEEDLDETTQDADVFTLDKDTDVEEVGPPDSQSSCFKIDKVFSVAKGKEELKQEVGLSDIKKHDVNGEGKRKMKNEEPKKSNSNSSREEKLLKPKTPTLTTLAKVPTLTSGVGGVRLLGGGMRGTNMPLLVSMGAGNPGIPLLPAGLPPGRYVILPGTSTTTKTTCSTVQTTSASIAPLLATGITTPTVAAPLTATASAIVSQATSTVATPSTVAAATAVAAAAMAVPARSITPTTSIPAQVPQRSHTRERGRRKSYTTGEKLAMIEAVEAGQRKSTVADRFGVAPSTLACILAQKNRIRGVQDNLMRRRFRHVKYMTDEGRGGSAITGGVAISTTPTLQSLTPSPPDQPFTHFLASLTGPSPAVFDTQPEEIIAVPDLMEGGNSGSSNQSGPTGGGGIGSREGGIISNMSEGKGEGDGDEDDCHVVEGLAVADGGVGGVGGGSGVPRVSMDTEYHQHESSSLHDKSAILSHYHHPHYSMAHGHLNDATEESVPQEISDAPPSPCTQGLTGPYLLKKETHCATVLDQLLRDDTYTDVTLTAEGQSLRAHRIVLSLASPYFRQVLSREQNVQSVVLLRDVKFAELRNIIHFIYTGEATVDASDLESFMRTADMLEITSLSEGQKYISSRGLSQGGATSGFSIGDFERLVGAKRSSKEHSSPPSKSRRVSGEGPSSRASSAEPSATSIPLSLIKEEPNIDPPTASRDDKTGNISTAVSFRGDSSDSNIGGATKSSREVNGGKRKRRDSSGSIGGFASIAGIQKALSEVEDDEEVFTPPTKSNNRQSEDHDKTVGSTETHMAIPGRCPYCPHVNQTFELIAMMKHLLVSHPCKPAFPCSCCGRVFVKRSNFKSHLQTCQQAY